MTKAGTLSDKKNAGITESLSRAAWRYQITRLDPTEAAAIIRQSRIIEAFALLADNGIGMPDAEMAECHFCAEGDHR